MLLERNAGSHMIPTGTTTNWLRDRLRKILQFLMVGAAGLLLSILLHRTLDDRFGRVAVGGLAGFILGVALGVTVAEERSDRVFYAAVFGTICAVFSSANAVAAMQ